MIKSFTPLYRDVGYAIAYFSKLILFSVWRTDRSNAKFPTFSSGKTDNARRCREADILHPSLSGLGVIVSVDLH